MKVRITKEGDGYVATLSLGMDGGPVIGDLSVAAAGYNRADALEKAAMVAERITSDPVMMAMMPPQVTAAVIAAKLLGRAANIGMPELRAMFGTLRKPSQRRLAKVLARDAAAADNGDDDEPEVGARQMPPPRAAPVSTVPQANRARITDHRTDRQIVTEDGRSMMRSKFRVEEAAKRKAAGGPNSYLDPRMLIDHTKGSYAAEYGANERSSEVTLPPPMPPPFNPYDPYGMQPQPQQPYNPYAPQQPYNPYAPQQPYNPYAPPGYQPMVGPNGMPLSPFTPGYQPGFNPYAPTPFYSQQQWDPYNPAFYPPTQAPSTDWWVDPSEYDWYGADNDPYAGGAYGYMDPGQGWDGGYGYEADYGADNGGE